MRIDVRLLGKPPKFKRYMIVRDHDGVEEYWNGKVWSRKSGLLYENEQVMARDYEKLQMEQVSHLPERVFIAPVVIRVRANGDFTPQQLKEHLFAAARLHLDHEKGTGPVADSVIFLDIVWNDAKETSPDGVEKPSGDQGRQTQ